MMHVPHKSICANNSTTRLVLQPFLASLSHYCSQKHLHIIRYSCCALGPRGSYMLPTILPWAQRHQVLCKVLPASTWSRTTPSLGKCLLPFRHSKQITIPSNTLYFLLVCIHVYLLHTCVYSLFKTLMKKSIDDEYIFPCLSSTSWATSLA